MLPAWYDEIARRTSEAMRPKYGNLYGFDAATPANAQMVAEHLFSYRRPVGKRTTAPRPRRGAWRGGGDRGPTGHVGPSRSI
jgi:hypothetical protein